MDNNYAWAIPYTEIDFRLGVTMPRRLLGKQSLLADTAAKKSQLARRRIVAVDLFCGAGGLTRGLLDAGIKVLAGYDTNAECRHAYEHNNDGAQFKCMSVADVDGSRLFAGHRRGAVRVLVGCAPCQTFSKYTQGRNALHDPKWALLSEFGRLVRESRPDIVSMENVPEIARHSVFQRFVQTLEDEGFHVEQDPEKRVVYCPDYGIPQRRRRLVLIASRFGPVQVIAPTHAADSHPTVSDVLKGLPKLTAGDVCPSDPLHRSSRLSALNLRRMKHSRPGGTWRDWPAELVAACHTQDSGKSYPGVYGRMSWDEPAPTITTQFYGFGNGRFGHPEQHRGLSLREGALLQSFPEDYEFVQPDGEYRFKTIGRMIGNAVPVRLGEVVGQSILKHVEST